MYGLLRQIGKQGKVVKSLQHTQKAFQHKSITYGPPRYRISFAEKVASGLVMTVAILAPATYITMMLPTYRENGEGGASE